MSIEKVKTAVNRLDERLAVSMRQVEDADFILALGVDPVNEAPMLALAMRQAQRKGRDRGGGGPQARFSALYLFPFGRGSR